MPADCPLSAHSPAVCEMWVGAQQAMSGHLIFGWLILEVLVIILG